jgi:hypothetical protein
MAAADAVATGTSGPACPDAAPRDFATLAERVTRTTDHLLDAQSQLVRAENLAGIGRLAAGIAHEVGTRWERSGHTWKCCGAAGPSPT